ncbi:MAG TPA: hypothetical protein ENN75_01510 [candidate division Zixibacteria bacterium]|nr:hypothetical protein [candidate division Zixibacteria bacterium]
METTLDEKQLSEILKKSIREVIETEFEREIRPRLLEIDRILEMLEDGVLAQIATERLAEIERGTATISLDDMEKKYAV